MDSANCCIRVYLQNGGGNYCTQNYVTVTAADHVSSLLTTCSRLLHRARASSSEQSRNPSGMSDVFRATVLDKLMYPRGRASLRLQTERDYIEMHFATVSETRIL